MKLMLSVIVEDLRRLCVRNIGIFGVLVFACVSFGCHAQDAPPGRIMRAAEEAHRNNIKSIRVPLPLMMQRQISSLDEELHSSFAFVVEPVARATTIDKGGNTIVSWYKLKVIRAFSHTTLGEHEDEATLLSHLPDLPRQLLPIAKNEIVVHFIGGPMVIDGVNVTYGPEDARLISHKSYVLFVGRLGFNDSTKSSIGFGPINNWSSVFMVDADGDTLVPLLPAENSIVRSRVAEEFGGRLSGISRKAPEVKP